jgi:hypothetical protein
MKTLAELKELVASNYDPDLVVEVLEITTEELLDNFEDKLWEHRHKFLELEEREDE